MGRKGFVVPPETQGSLPKKAGGSSSWILINYSGESTILDLNKYAILRRVMIHARDLRVLDPLLSYPSTILGRERAIVLNLEADCLFFWACWFQHIKAIITEEEALLRDPMDCNVVPVVEELQRRLQPLNAICEDQGEEGANTVFLNENNGSEENESPFEFRALEVAIEAVCIFLDARTMELENVAYPALDELTSKISSCNLDRVRKIKSSMTRLTNRVQKVRDGLEQLLDNDGDMAELCLSRKKAWSSSPRDASCEVCCLQNSTVRSKLSRGSRASAITFLGENGVEELEMLLEAYFMQIDGTLNKLATLREYVNDTEDYINIQLDSHRNQLIQLQLFLSSGTTCLSVYSLVVAIFGMNIPYTWKEGHGYIFKWVVIFTGITSTSLFMSIMLYARHKGLIGI